jgi:penicillin-binding protein 1C
MAKFTLKQCLKSIYPAVYTLQSFKQSFSGRPRFRFNRFVITAVFAGIFISFVSFYVFVLKDLPSPSVLSTQDIPLTTHIRDRNGRELYKIYLNQNRTLIKLTGVPVFARQAILAIEDKNFYSHRGFSVTGIFRALYNNLICSVGLSQCSVSFQGGSTITQQLVKTSLLTPEQTLQRKLKELVLSVAVEAIYSKDQILEMYLNRVGFGGATYGLEEASQTYFGIPASGLNLAQAAYLAGLPASPTTYSPYGAHPELAKARQKEVLKQMVSAGFISWSQAAAAAAYELVLRPPATDIKAPHFVMYIRDLLAQKYGDAMVEQGGLDVTTSLDLSVQESAEKIVTAEMNKISKLHITNGAALVTRPGTGEILAMVGSKDYFDLSHDGNVNVTLSARQPGSSIKPLNYALAFRNGFTPASVIDDSPITYSVPGEPPYSPVNYDNRYHGQVTIRTALASSYNIPAVKILSANGVDNLISFAKTMGITTWDDPHRFGLSLTLGSGEVKMTDMATAYGVFANGGDRVDLAPILEVKDHQGHVLEQYQPGSENRVLDPKIAFLISDILSDNSARAPTFGPVSQLNIPKATVAVKTGTTNDMRDNWTIGFTPDFLVAVWVGNNDNSPMSYVASGVTGASPIWRKITDNMLNIYPSSGFSPPSDLLKISVCPSTGQLPCSSCPGKPEYFISGTQPKTSCSDDVIKEISDRLLEGLSTQR